MRCTSIVLPMLATAGLLCACASLHAPGSTTPQPPEPDAGIPPGELLPPGQPVPPEQPSRPSQRQFRLGAAATALVTQAHVQATGGNYGLAAATLERALRIEPDNPLLWIELGQVRLGEGNLSQADGMGRKAAALATGDPQAQAAAWRLIAESLRQRGRNEEATDAFRRAETLAPRLN